MTKNRIATVAGGITASLAVLIGGVRRLRGVLGDLRRCLDATGLTAGAAVPIRVNRPNRGPLTRIGPTEERNRLSGPSFMGRVRWVVWCVPDRRSRERWH
jgi:hypothetical protein